MKKERRLIATSRGICKCCNAEYEKLRLFRKKAENNEDNYLTCNDCDRLFNKYNRGNPSGNNQNTSKNPELYELTYKKLLNVNCPFCKSENIEKY
jgi:hypothetical protein